MEDHNLLRIIASLICATIGGTFLTLNSPIPGQTVHIRWSTTPTLRYCLLGWPPLNLPIITVAVDWTWRSTWSLFCKTRRSRSQPFSSPASTRRHKSSLNHGQILRLLMCLGVHVFWLGDPSGFWWILVLWARFTISSLDNGEELRNWGKFKIPWARFTIEGVFCLRS
jgi:hypothetical protein